MTNHIAVSAETADRAFVLSPSGFVLVSAGWTSFRGVAFVLQHDLDALSFGFVGGVISDLAVIPLASSIRLKPCGKPAYLHGLKPQQLAAGLILVTTPDDR